MAQDIAGSGWSESELIVSSFVVFIWDASGALKKTTEREKKK